MNIREEFGKRLKLIREVFNMSQDKLSLLSGVDRSFISDIENGKYAPSLDTINRISKAFKVHPSEFFEFSTAEPTMPYEADISRTDKDKLHRF